MKESRTLEYNAQITNSFLKTVSAFSNFGTGEIKFGINDDGSVCGIDNLEDTCLDLENRINDTITPKPDYSLNINTTSKTITLTVYEGNYKPYLYKGKAYRRSDTATIEVDQLELKRLTLEGSNLYFEGLPCDERNLTFSYVENVMKIKLGISDLTEDILRTLGFLSEKRVFNNAAALFADSNNFPGIDMARFGDSISVILDRELYCSCSILEQYEKAVSLYRKYYQYEEISGVDRVSKELVPEKAFREAVANALVHRTWDIYSHIRIAMFPDRIEITSPGGLSTGVTKEEYLKGNISYLRNPIIGNMFFRLHYIEMFGTGIQRIKEAYSSCKVQPAFDIFDNSIRIVLPLITAKYQITEEEQVVINLLSTGRILSSREIGNAMEFSKDKAIRILNGLIEKRYVKIIGNGRGTKYILS
ncbi:MAG: putative DNA binding domain-containing protein [Erysipelotrichaceae bacterium]|nr:putative DNA binding domain-containing protein [Erysipelotrichaceae bacterium]